MSEFLLRDIDPDLRKKFKSACAWYGISMKEVLIKHIQNIVKDYLVALKIYDKPKIYTKKGAKKK